MIQLGLSQTEKGYDALTFRNGNFTWLDLGGESSYSGRRVSQETALQTIAVLRCVTLISGAAASLPIDVFTKRRGQRQPADNHAVEKLLDSAPNPLMSSMDFRAVQWTHFLLWGNSYAKIEWAGDRPIALWPLHPACIEVRTRETDGSLVYLYTPPGSGTPIPYPQREILHVRWFSLDGITGLSAIEQARHAIGRRQDAEEYGARYFGNGAKPSFVINHPKAISERAEKNLKETFQKRWGGLENAHKILVLEEDMKIQTLTINPKDSQFLEQEQYSDEQIAMLFGVPPHMIGLLSKTTSWGTGIAEQKLGFLTFSLNPLLVFFEKAYERCLLSDTRESRYFIKHNVNAFLRSDVKSRMEAYAIGVDKGIFSRNECRALEDLDPYDGGDVKTVQMQMIDVRDIGKQFDSGGAPSA
jgi:HK97 family phage portal protein